MSKSEGQTVDLFAAGYSPVVLNILYYFYLISGKKKKYLCVYKRRRGGGANIPRQKVQFS